MPLFLFFVLKDLWVYSREKNYKDKIEWTLLEIRIPQDVLKTPKAMEYVLVALHGVWDELNMRDTWIKGEVLPSFSLEIAGIEGEAHFFVYTQVKVRDLVESAIYSQYPDAEIYEVEDYTNIIPPDAPNKDWDVWGSDLALFNDDAYPLRSYEDFEEMVEERRLDPMATLAETINKLRKGEYIWVQIMILPNMGMLEARGNEIVGELMKRRKEQKPNSTNILVKSATDSIAKLGESVMDATKLNIPLGDKTEDDKDEHELLWPEMNLSPGEREVLKRVEDKKSKVAFETMIRFVYVARNDVFSRANVSGLFGFFRQFNIQSSNGFKPNSKTLPKSSFIFFKKTRTYMRKHRLINWYRRRDNMPGNISRSFLLNVEELATIFHFPGLIVKAPGMSRVESRKAPPPPTLPIE